MKTMRMKIGPRELFFGGEEAKFYEVEVTLRGFTKIVDAKKWQ